MTALQKVYVPIGAAVLLIILLIAFSGLAKVNILFSHLTSHNTGNIAVTVTNTPAPTQPVALVSTVNIYLIAISDNGQSGIKIGCGDAVVPVIRSIAPTSAPLRAAIDELLSLHQQYLGNSGLYNSLYQSNLQVDNVYIDNSGLATIKLKGDMKLGGVCDNPRFDAQIKNTALQFTTVKSVSVFINNQPMD